MSESNDREALLTSLYPEMLAYAFKMNSSEAEDIANTAFSRVWESHKQGKLSINDEFLRYYCMRATRNCFIDTIRNRDQRKTFCVEKFHNEPLALNGESLDADLILHKISALPYKYSRPGLMFVAGYSYKEIAEVLCLPMGTVKSYIYYFRKLCKNILSLHGYNV